MFLLKVRPNRFFALGAAFTLSLACLLVMLVAIASAKGDAPRTWGSSEVEAGKAPQQNGVVRMEPAVTVVGNGETFRVYVVIDDAEDLGSFQFIIDYDPIVIEVPKQPNPMVLGNFLDSTGRTPNEFRNEIDPVTGVITYVVFTTGSNPGPNGDGVLAFVDLRARALGTSALDLKDVEITDTSGTPQSTSVEDGFVVVASSPNPAQVSINKSAEPLRVPPQGLLTYTLQRSFSFAGAGHTYDEIAFDPIPSGTTYLPGSVTLNELPAPQLYSATLDAIYFQSNGTFTDTDQWTISFQVQAGSSPSGTLILNAVTETTSFDGAAYSGPYISNVEVIVLNNPPITPSNPSPADGATGVPINADLSWTGGDPDPGDTITYDVYFEADDSTPDDRICDDVSTPICDPGTLGYDTHYYWYVAATDNHGASTTGDTWDFTTTLAPAPAPETINPSWGYINQVVNVTVTGEHFQPGATAKLVRGEADIQVDVGSVSEFQITGVVTLTNAATVQWDLRVTNPDDQSGDLVKAFTVKERIVYLPVIFKNRP